MKFKAGNKVLYENEKYIVAEVYGDGYRITGDEGYSRWACENELELIKPTIDDLRDYMLEHFVNEDGNLYIEGLDFSEFSGNIYLSHIKVREDLYQNRHKVGGSLHQSWHEVNGDYICKEVKYGGKLYTNDPQKLLKEVTKEELAELGYKLKG